jgi:hypothetical protein
MRSLRSATEKDRGGEVVSQLPSDVSLAHLLASLRVETSDRVLDGRPKLFLIRGELEPRSERGDSRIGESLSLSSGENRSIIPRPLRSTASPRIHCPCCAIAALPDQGAAYKCSDDPAFHLLTRVQRESA